MGGKVVEDLKDSDEGESATLFLCAHPELGTTIIIQSKPQKTDVPMVYNRQQITMKKRKSTIAFIATFMMMAAFCLSSCGSMSNEDAYNIGYGAGTLIRVMSGN